MTLVERLIAFAILLQGLESLHLNGWRWEILCPEIPRALRPFTRSHAALARVQVLAGFVSFIFPSLAGTVIMLLATWLLAVRWRGTFNGGSDTLTVHILAACIVARIAHGAQVGAILYIALYITLSYCAAGLFKLRRHEWREGRALARFLKRQGSMPLRSWAVIGFECLFPLALIWPASTWPWLAVAVLFHAANVYYFGLNRFFYVWLAGYPAILAASRILHPA